MRRIRDAFGAYDGRTDGEGVRRTDRQHAAP
jgi:hypothetical protein